jgi:two-component system sensor histidine kinase GlrK
MLKLTRKLLMSPMFKTWHQATVSTSVVNQAIYTIAIPFVLLVTLTTWFAASLDRTSEQVWDFFDKNQSIDQRLRTLEATLSTIQEATLNNRLLNDPQLAAALDKKRTIFKDAVFDLKNLGEMDGFVAKWQQLHDSLTTNTPSEDDFTLTWQYWYALKDQIHAQRQNLQQQIDTDVKQKQRFFFVGLAILIPLITLISFFILFQIKRKLGAIELAAVQLGEGVWDTPILIDGNTELVQLGEKLDNLRVRLRNHLQEQDTFLRHVSHELKTPLASIAEGTALLNEQLLGEINRKQQRVLGIVEKSANQLGSLIEDLLLFSSAASLGNSTTKVDIEVISQELKHHFNVQQINKSAVLQWEHSPNLKCTISYLPCKLALTQIISNGLRFARSVVKVTIKESNGYIEMVVCDDGPGFSVESAQLATTPFYRGADSNNNQKSHSGLGLSIAQECCTSMGAKLIIFPTDTYPIHQGHHRGGCVTILYKQEA